MIENEKFLNHYLRKFEGINLIPGTITSRIIFASALLLSLFSIWVSWSMWQVELGYKPVAAGGGEYMVALFLGLPSALCSMILYAIITINKKWRSQIASVGFLFALLIVISIFSISSALVLFLVFIIFTVLVIFKKHDN